MATTAGMATTAMARMVLARLVATMVNAQAKRNAYSNDNCEVGRGEIVKHCDGYFADVQ